MLKTKFSCSISKISDSDMDQFISKANLSYLKEIFPDFIDLDENKDIAGIVLNAAVAGRRNRNGDAITKEDALHIANNFKNKYVNIEHQQNHVVGCIVNVGYSSFGSNELLTREEIEKEDFKDPFNISLALVIWKSILTNESVDFLEDAGDESSDAFGSVSASWELFFEGYDIAVGSKNVSEATLITDEKEKEKLAQYLRSKGGSGTKDGKFVYRVLKRDFLIPAGIGLVESPAAEVKGMIVIQPEEKKIEEIEEIEEENHVEEEKEQMVAASSDEKEEQNKEKISISNETNVKTDNKKPISNKIFNMKIKLDKIEDLTEEVLEKSTASTIQESVHELFNKTITEGSKKWEEEKNSQAEAAKAAEEKAAQIQKEHDELVENFASLESELTALKEQALAKEKQEKFNVRMDGFENKFEINDDVREVLASEIKDLSDEDFDKYLNKMELLLSKKQEKSEAAVVEEEKKETKEEAPEKSTASEKTIDEAVKNAEKQEEIPNASEPTKMSLKERMATAFSLENTLETSGKRKMV